VGRVNLIDLNYSGADRDAQVDGIAELRRDGFENGSGPAGERLLRPADARHAGRLIAESKSVILESVEIAKLLEGEKKTVGGWPGKTAQSGELLGRERNGARGYEIEETKGAFDCLTPIVSIGSLPGFAHDGASLSRQ
jgi:hypothetical protein